ncbi:transglutaminase-like domain-containing protein [Robiginitalea sp. IMCC43444]|uniref:transglutaminase-like domain-containing protein n=1 Tax=Robiginitalea sp. IMCC43444 TaxID=3459121 RepID=UPI00404328CB
MTQLYKVQYESENEYEHPLIEAYWQFLIIPEVSEGQQLLSAEFTNSLGLPWEYSVNPLGFQAIRLRARQSFQQISFKGVFTLEKAHTNPFDFDSGALVPFFEDQFGKLDFKVAHQRYLRHTRLTTLPETKEIFRFEEHATAFENLKALNEWVNKLLEYKGGVTHVESGLDEVLNINKGVCQDFAHLFIAVARKHGIPARYVSGYLHQGLGYFGDSQMHAWTEAFIPSIGWLGFDPTNNLLASTDHIKVAHGKDYADCAAIKGVVIGPGGNESRHKVIVESQQ